MSALGAVVLGLGIVAEPAVAGGWLFHKAYVAYPAGGPAVGAGSYIPATLPGAASYMPAYYYPAPAAYTYPTSYYAPTAYAPAAYGYGAQLMGFSADEQASYYSHPALAAHLGNTFPQFHKGLVAHAKALKKSGTRGTQLVNALQGFATNILPGILSLVPGGQLANEVLDVVGNVATQVDSSTPATRPRGGSGRGVTPGGTVGGAPVLSGGSGSQTTPSGDGTDTTDETDLNTLAAKIADLANALDPDAAAIAAATANAVKTVTDAAKAADAELTAQIARIKADRAKADAESLAKDAEDKRAKADAARQPSPAAAVTPATPPGPNSQ
jgi:hypothetical protein